MALPRISDAERRRRIGVRQAVAPAHRLGSVEAVTRAMTVLHATEAATVHLAVAARSEGLDVDDVDRALYDERSIVKQLAMRRTLFVFPRDLLPAAWGSASARVATAERKRVARMVEQAGLADDGAAWLDHQSQFLRRPALRRSDLRFADRYARSIAAGENIERQRRHAQRLERIAGGRGRVGADGFDPRCLKRAAHVVPAFGLDDGDRAVLQRQRDACLETTAAAWDHDPAWYAQPERRHLRRGFDPGAPLPLDNPRIVEARHQRRTPRFCRLRGEGLTAFGGAVVGDDLRA